MRVSNAFQIIFLLVDYYIIITQLHVKLLLNLNHLMHSYFDLCQNSQLKSSRALLTFVKIHSLLTLSVNLCYEGGTLFPTPSTVLQ